MRFSKPRRRASPESIVPMINVVFLLLIFFLMSARLAPPPPFDLTIPTAAVTGQFDETRVLFVSDDGTLALDALRGAAVWQALASSPVNDRLSIRADATVPATDIAAILGRLAALGVTKVDLAARPQ